MRVRQLSPTGDYKFGNSQLDFLVNSSAAVAQLIQTNLLLWSGEWYLNTSYGTPWLSSIIGKHSQAQADSAIQTQILSIQGPSNQQLVVSIVNYSSSYNGETRFYSFVATGNTIFGPTTLEMQNFVNF